GGVTVRRFPNRTASAKFPFAPGIFSYLGRHGMRYGIVHAHSYHALPALGAALARHENLVFTPHYLGPEDTAAMRALHAVYATPGRLIFRRAARVVCVTHTEAAAVRSRFAVPPDRIAVIPNGIDTGGIRAAAPHPAAGRVILSAGRLEPYKNVDRTIRAL